MKLDINKIIKLGNGEYYFVISYVNNNNKDYYYIAECDQDGKDILDNYKIVTSTNKDGNIYLDEVIGEANLKIILPLFVKNIVNN